MKSHLELFLTYFFFLGVLVPGFFAFLDWNRRKAKGAPIPPSKFTKKLVTGWTIYLCIAAIVSGAGVYYDSKRIQSQPSELAGRHYMISSTPSGDEGDPGIRQELADRDQAKWSTWDIMSIDFISETEIELNYLGETYNGRFTDDPSRSSVSIETSAPAFPEGLSGTYESYGRGRVIRPAGGDGGPAPTIEAPLSSRLTLNSDKFTYALVDDREIDSPPRPLPPNSSAGD